MMVWQGWTMDMCYLDFRTMGHEMGSHSVNFQKPALKPKPLSSREHKHLVKNAPTCLASTIFLVRSSSFSLILFANSSLSSKSFFLSLSSLSHSSSLDEVSSL